MPTAATVAYIEARQGIGRPANEREERLLDRLETALVELAEARESNRIIDAMLDERAREDETRAHALERLIETRDTYARSHEVLCDVKDELDHEREGARMLREDKADMARDIDALRARAELAEHQVAEMRAAMHAIVVTRRGNVLHLHLPEVLHVPARGWNHDWNTLSVPVVATREEVKGTKKREPCPCCQGVARAQINRTRQVDTTWLSYSPERT